MGIVKNACVVNDGEGCVELVWRQDGARVYCSVEMWDIQPGKEREQSSVVLDPADARTLADMLRAFAAEADHYAARRVKEMADA